MKLKSIIDPISMLLAGVILCSSCFAQTSASGSVPAKPVVNSTEKSAGIENKSSAPALSNNKVKVVEKKNRKPAHVTKKPAQIKK